MQVKLSNCEVTLKDELTWGDSEEISAESLAALEMSPDVLDKVRSGKSEGTIKMNGKAILAAKYKAAELIITRIVLADGTERTYSREWLHGLSREDGTLLDSHITPIREGKNLPKE